jgi:hypothetical protein
MKFGEISINDKLGRTVSTTVVTTIVRKLLSISKGMK